MKEILSQQGSFKKVREWIDGWHKDKGKLTRGWRGEEQTLVERDEITPLEVINVVGEEKAGASESYSIR